MTTDASASGAAASLRVDRARALLGAASAVVALVAADLIGIATRRPGLTLDAGVVVFVLVGFACGAVLALPVALLRREIHALGVRHGPLGRAVAGAIDALAVFALVVHVQSPRALEGKHTFVVLVAVLAGAVVGILATGTGRMSKALAVVTAGTAAVIASHQLATLRWNGHPSLRLGMHLLLVASVAALARRFGPRPSLRGTVVGASLLVGVTLALSGVLLETSATARTLLHRRSSHVQTWAYVLESALDLDGDRAANVLGGRDCDPSRSDVSPIATELAGDGLDANCAGGPGRTRPRPRVASPGQGAAVGSDVILLSVDSLRHDVVDALSATRRALGPHATFDLAVSPSPMTRFSLSANLRGRAVRQIRFEDEPTDTLATLRHDRSPTIGHVLGDNGYRCVYVATTDHLDPPTRVAAGFHALDVTGFGAPPWRAGWPRRGKWFYRAPDAFSLLLRAARSTRGPLCAWTHLMDSHYPYYRGEVPASFDLAGLRASVRDLDGRIAAFLRAFAAIRRRPVVVAMFGDHGEAFDEHGTTHHASATYAEQVRVGALLAGPGVRPGRYAPPVTTTQLAPSVLELVGVRPPAPMTEPSLLAAMHGRGAWPEVAVSELHHAARHRVEVGYMTERWHLVRDAVHDVDELFDVRRDPREAHDVSRSEPAAAAAMRRLAARWDETH